jgi:hypothetical protein
VRMTDEHVMRHRQHRFHVAAPKVATGVIRRAISLRRFAIVLRQIPRAPDNRTLRVRHNPLAPSLTSPRWRPEPCVEIYSIHRHRLAVVSGDGWDDHIGCRGIGDLVKTTAGTWIIRPPMRCPNGHEFGPGRALVGYLACLGHGGGHTTWTCRTCDPDRLRAADEHALRGAGWACGGADLDPTALIHPSLVFIARSTTR